MAQRCAGMDLPSVIPIFPLPNVVLFPGVPLPLHIFEPRYRQMVRDAAAGHEVIGMALLRGNWQRDYSGNPEVFETGCAGKMVNVESLPDGKFNVLLHGVREFTIQQQSFEQPYRQATVSWRVRGQAGLADTARGRLVGLLTRLVGEGNSAALRLLRDPSLTDDLLVNFFSYALEIDPLEKQSLLEAPTLVARAERLAEIVEFHVEESRLGLKRHGPDRCH